MENEIKIINQIIAESVINGGDAGGSYESNTDYLIKSIEQWLKLKQLTDKYEVRYVEIEIRKIRDSMLQIVEKNNKNNRLIF